MARGAPCGLAVLQHTRTRQTGSLGVGRHPDPCSAAQAPRRHCLRQTLDPATGGVTSRTYPCAWAQTARPSAARSIGRSRVSRRSMSVMRLRAGTTCGPPSRRYGDCSRSATSRCDINIAAAKGSPSRDMPTWRSLHGRTARRDGACVSVQIERPDRRGKAEVTPVGVDTRSG